jgi:hypothetical protein
MKSTSTSTSTGRPRNAFDVCGPISRRGALPVGRAVTRRAVCRASYGCVSIGWRSTSSAVAMYHRPRHGDTSPSVMPRLERAISSSGELGPEVPPLWVGTLDQRHLPPARPLLQPLLAPDCGLDRVLRPYQTSRFTPYFSVKPGMTPARCSATRRTRSLVTQVQGTIAPARHDVDPAAEHRGRPDVGSPGQAGR